MAGIIKARIDVQKLPKEKFYKGKKGVYYEFILSINDDTNNMVKTYLYQIHKL